jgi:acetyltransferase-like isoleucine patch superfamily enzyme
LLPGVTLHEGAAIGALSLVKDDAPEWTICGGSPAEVLKPRSRALLGIEARMHEQL